MKKSATVQTSSALFARTIHGIEWIAAAEIEKRLKAEITELRHREVRFRMPELTPALFDLGSVDDVFLTCLNFAGVDRSRASLELFPRAVASMNWDVISAPLKRLRNLPRRTDFDVVASFLGRRNYSRFEIEDSVGQAVADRIGWRYISRKICTKPDTNFSFRVHIVGDEAVIGLRLSTGPLHRRAYKVASRTGTLHPPLAFAMAMLCGMRERLTVLDLTCGVATIPIEVARLNPAVHSLGSDIDEDSIIKARANIRAASVSVDLLVLDAGKTPFKDSVVDRIVSNLPWGRVVDARGSLANDSSVVWKEIARIMSSDGRAVLLVNDGDNDAVDPETVGLKIIQRFPIALFGSRVQLWLMVHDKLQQYNVIDVKGDFGSELLKYWQRWPTDLARMNPSHVA